MSSDLFDSEKALQICTTAAHSPVLCSIDRRIITCCLNVFSDRTTDYLIKAL